MKRSILVCILFGCLAIAFASFKTTPAYADVVMPNDRVTNAVNIRATPSGDTVGKLRPGEHLEYLDSVPRWHKVRLPNDSEGFVSKAWTVVAPNPVDVSLASPFAIHFVDVGTGDATIIDMGDKEIIIDGGDSIRVLSEYIKRTGIIDGAIELVVVTHGDTDHWNGLRRALGFDGVEDDVPGVLEFWDAGYDRDCNGTGNNARKNYLKFVDAVKALVPASKFRRPLQDHFTPSTISNQLDPIRLNSLPGVTFTVLSTDASPDTGSCSYKINNASIVLMIEIQGIRFMFTGDANGKRELSPHQEPQNMLREIVDVGDSVPWCIES